MDNIQPSSFIEEWLNHFNVSFTTDLLLPGNNGTLDFYIQKFNIGILIVNWDKPISVQIINKAIICSRELELNCLYLIATQISGPAQENIKRCDQPIITIHPNGLSELATSFAQMVHTNLVQTSI